MRAPEPKPGRVASHSLLANGQFSGEIVPMPGTRTMLGLRVSGSTELSLTMSFLTRDYPEKCQLDPEVPGGGR